MIYPVWGTTWHFDDGLPEVAAGARWTVPLWFRPRAQHPGDAFPRFAASEVELDLVPIPGGGDWRRTFRAGPLLVSADSRVAPGRQVGTLSSDQFDGSPSLACSGLVTSIVVVPLRYADADKRPRAVEYLDPIPVASTADRSVVPPYGAQPADSKIFPKLLLQIDFDDEPSVATTRQARS